MESAALARGLLVEALYDAGPLLARRLDKVEHLGGAAIGTRPSKVITRKSSLSAGKLTSERNTSVARSPTPVV